MAIDDQDQEQKGITAYHGSPYKFDRFDLSKVGTGEGAQSRGHGLYFTQDENEAINFREKEPKIITSHPLSLEAHQFVNDYMDYDTSVEDAIQNAKKDAIKYAPHLMDELNKLTPQNVEKTKEGGHMYEVSINAHPDHFLDWDKSFDEQSTHVKNALVKMVRSGAIRPDIMNLTGENIHDHVQSKVGGDPAKASQFLFGSGIKGVKYDDDDLKNYVVFDDKLINVNRRYARGGMVQGYANGGAPEEIDTSYLANLWRGLQSIPEVAYNYLKDTPYEQMGSDAIDLGKHVYNDITENPIENLVTALPVVGSGKAAYDAYQINNRIQQAYKEGNHEDAKKLERALALSSLGAIPIFGELSSVGAGAARLVEDATLNGVTRAATRAATRAITNSLPQDAYQAAESMISETLSDAVKAARKRMFVGETDAKKSDKSGKYAHGGHVEGYDNGGSVSDAILKYAESLPTAEESIETLKQFGRDVGEDAANLGKRIFSGFEKMADQGLERSPPPTVRAGEREVYVEPPPPPPKLYTLPDGRRASKAELDLANEMAHERFSEQHAMPPVVQENMPSLDRPAPTRAPMRERMERQANVDRPVEPIASKTFKQAFNDARSRNEKTFPWTNPSTGKTMVYTTQLARKQGGRIPSFSQSDEWLADRNEPKIKANK